MSAARRALSRRQAESDATAQSCAKMRSLLTPAADFRALLRTHGEPDVFSCGGNRSAEDSRICVVLRGSLGTLVVSQPAALAQDAPRPVCVVAANAETGPVAAMGDFPRRRADRRREGIVPGARGGRQGDCHTGARRPRHRTRAQHPQPAWRRRADRGLERRVRGARAGRHDQRCGRCRSQHRTRVYDARPG